MKKYLIVLAAKLAFLAFLAISILGCEELEKASMAITDATEQIQFQATDPNSPVQRSAEELVEVVSLAIALAQPAQTFPWGKTVLVALNVALATLTFVLKLRKAQSDQVLEEVVHGGELFKKEKNGVDDFKQAQNIAQSVSTIKRVNKIRQKLA